MERRFSKRRRSDTRLGGTPADDRGRRSVGWRAVLVGAPLAYGIGTLLGHLAAIVAFGAPIGVLLPGAVVIVGCVLVSAALARVVDYLDGDDRPRSLAGRVSPRTSAEVGTAVLLPTFLFGLGLAVLG